MTMTATTPRHSQWATRYLGRPVREQLIEAGALRPAEQLRELLLPGVRVTGPVLRIDDAGRIAAAAHMREPPDSEAGALSQRDHGASAVVRTEAAMSLSRRLRRRQQTPAGLQMSDALQLSRPENIDRSEVTIKDQAGRAEVTRKPKRGGLRVQQSGGL